MHISLNYFVFRIRRNVMMFLMLGFLAWRANSGYRLRSAKTNQMFHGFVLPFCFG